MRMMKSRVNACCIDSDTARGGVSQGLYICAMRHQTACSFGRFSKLGGIFPVDSHRESSGGPFNPHFLDYAISFGRTSGLFAVEKYGADVFSREGRNCRQKTKNQSSHPQCSTLAGAGPFLRNGQIRASVTPSVRKAPVKVGVRSLLLQISHN